MPQVDPRRLLARLRDVMAGSAAAQKRLDKIVNLIAAEMRADVCSCYVMRAGEVLELFATIGLKQEAVHQTRLRVGEGIVGDIAAHARPMALSNAPSHPSFAYRPETGEDPFQSMMGVPILRSGRVRGVLAIQHREHRNYTEEEVETLQTIAMVVAEVIAASEIVSPQEISTGTESALMPTRLQGVSIHRGLAMGVAVVHRQQLTIRQLVSDNPEHERERLAVALGQLHESIDQLLLAASASGGGEHVDILETYKMFAADKGWLTKIREAIDAGLTAEAAVQKVQNDTRTKAAQLADSYIRERLLDLEDLTNRLLRHLGGKAMTAHSATLPDDIILVARSIGPAELLEYDRKHLRALVLEDGSATSHVAIIAKAFDIPVVGQCPDALVRIEPLDPLVVDGENGQVFIRPSEDIQDTVTRSVALRASRQREYSMLRELPAETRDGVRVSLNLNCGLLMDLPHLETTGADGIGLYRTEIPFMVRSEYPEVEHQTELYAKVFELAGDRPIRFRTLDIGGDKVLPYFPIPAEENPALGWRAIRIGLDRPAMLRRQIRALLRAAQGRTLHVMLPMVAEVAELHAARRLIDMEVVRLGQDGYPTPAGLKVGVMLEVPALLWQLPTLLPQVDFVSVGSNDLLQYVFAIDRGNPKVGSRYDSLSPPFLSLLRELSRQCDAAGVSLSVCGEMAGRPLDAMALVALGLRSLSMTPTSLGPVKTMIRSLHVEELRNYVFDLLEKPDHSLRSKLRAYARDHNIAL